MLDAIASIVGTTIMQREVQKLKEEIMNPLPKPKYTKPTRGIPIVGFDLIGKITRSIKPFMEEQLNLKLDSRDFLVDLAKHMVSPVAQKLLSNPDMTFKIRSLVKAEIEDINNNVSKQTIKNLRKNIAKTKIDLMNYVRCDMDFIDTVVQTTTATTTTITTDNSRYQLEVKPNRQRLEALKIEFSFATTDYGYTISKMVLEAANVGGIYRQPTTKRAT